MKTLIAAFLVLLCSASYAQITLEHEFTDSNEYFTLVQIDSGEYYYMLYDYGEAHDGSFDIKLFDLDYNLFKVIDIPVEISSSKDPGVVIYVTRRLFDLDDSIEYIMHRLNNQIQLYSLRIFKESGTLLFSCDSCSLGHSVEDVNVWKRGIYNTPKGVKMLIMRHYYFGLPLLPGNRVYSLPGKLPTTSTSAVTDDIAYIQSALNIESFPNPASDRIQVNYKLPAGTTSGFITIRDTKGAELQRHRINYTEGSIGLDTQGLSPGSYYCCLLTDDGRTAVKKMVVVR